MNITKVSFEKKGINCKSLAVCSVVFDDCLKLNDIKLFRNDKGYYLVLPSKQDIYQEVQELNKGNNILLESQEDSNEYDEFFHPVTSSLYKVMLETVVNCYARVKKEKCYTFRF